MSLDIMLDARNVGVSTNGMLVLWSIATRVVVNIMLDMLAGVVESVGVSANTDDMLSGVGLVLPSVAVADAVTIIVLKSGVTVIGILIVDTDGEISVGLGCITPVVLADGLCEVLGVLDTGIGMVLLLGVSVTDALEESCSKEDKRVTVALTSVVEYNTLDGNKGVVGRIIELGSRRLD